jgi:hypothetical protein
MLEETKTRTNMLSAADIDKKLHNRNLKYTSSKHQESNTKQWKLLN